MDRSRVCEDVDGSEDGSDGMAVQELGTRCDLSALFSGLGTRIGIGFVTTNNGER